MPRKVVVLLSGGLDSVVALYNAKQLHDVLAAVSFNYGSKHNHVELPCAAYHCMQLKVPHRIIPLDFMAKLFESALLTSGNPIPDGHYQERTMQQTVVPFRNGIMLSIAGGYAESLGAKAVLIAAHAGDHVIYPDCRELFMMSFAEALRVGTYSEIEIDRPFIKLNKSYIVRRGVELGVDFTKTWSCYKGGDIHCGTCGTCVERREAFIQAAIPDPTPYANTGPLPQKP